MARGEILDVTESMYTPFEPKQTHRGIFYVEGIPTWMIKSFGMPGIEGDEFTVDYLNTKWKGISKMYTFQDITLSLYDPIEPNGQQLVMNWVRLTIETETGRMGYPEQYRKNCSIVMLGPPLDKVSEWSIVGAFIKGVKFGDNIDYSSPGLNTIELTLGCQRCDLLY